MALGYQPNNWMDKTILLLWLERILIPHINDVRAKNPQANQKALLVLDNHSTRRNIEFLNLAEENNIMVVFLLAHTSHITQPLDVGIFGQFKTILRKKMTEKRIQYEEEEAEEKSSKYRTFLFEMRTRGWESGTTQYDVLN